MCSLCVQLLNFNMRLDLAVILAAAGSSLHRLFLEQLLDMHTS